MRWLLLLGLARLRSVYGVATTDFLQDTACDPAQSGYLPNHNISPANVPSFVFNWKNNYNTNEAFYAKPLVWTPPGAAAEQVIVVSNQNIIRILDGLTGTLIAERALDPPFQSVDTGGCGDIPNTVGITGTPIIDPATNIMYLFSKGYKGAVVGPAGTLAGQYKFYAIQLPSLADVSGFPIIIDGHFADNDHTRYFVGGTVLNRPGLAMIGNTVIGGFGGHCDNFNYTGMLVGVSKIPGVGITSIMAMEAGPYAPQPQPLDITVQNGGKAGIWQSGFGLSVDATNNRVFFVTGQVNNGEGGAGENAGGTPASGHIPIGTLQQATVNMGVSAAGVFTQQDYFEPYEYASLDGGDIDFGSSGAALLPPFFSGGSVNQVVVAGGKSGKIYFMDANNLGGFATGPGGSDGVLQTIFNNQGAAGANKLLSGVASYPAEGGYIYFCPTAQAGLGANLIAYKFTPLADGTPHFAFAGKSAAAFAGVGAPTVTSLGGAPGSAIVWMADVNNGLVAYNAIPQNGVLIPISSVATGRLMKYQRPSFGNARVYTVETSHIYGIGSSTAPPITCASTSIGFGSLVAGLTKVITVECTAGSAAVTLAGCSTNLDIFQCSNVPTTLAAAASFTMSVTLNLTSAAIELTRTANNIDIVPGSVAGALELLQPNTVVPLATLAMTGTVVATGGYIDLSAVQLDFSGLQVGGSSTLSLTVKNDGAGVLSFTGFAYQNAYGASYTNVTTTGSPVVVGSAFTATGFPLVGSTIVGGGSITITLTFSPTVTGTSASILTFWSNGGWQDVMLVGTASKCTVSCSTLAKSSTVSSSSVLSSSSVRPSSSVHPSSSVLPSSSVRPSSSVLSSSSVRPSSVLSSSSSVLSSHSTSNLIVTTSSPLSSKSSSQLSSIKSSTHGPSSNVATTTISLTPSTFITSTSSARLSTATASGFAYMGCYRDTINGHALPLLVANSSMTPQLCESLVSALAVKPSPTFYPFYYVEYHSECYAGSSFAFGTQAVTSLTGTHACTDLCAGSSSAVSTGTALCGGSRQFDLYATKSSMPFAVATTQAAP